MLLQYERVSVRRTPSLANEQEVLRCGGVVREALTRSRVAATDERLLQFGRNLGKEKGVRMVEQNQKLLP